MLSPDDKLQDEMRPFGAHERATSNLFMTNNMQSHQKHTSDNRRPSANSGALKKVEDERSQSQLPSAGARLNQCPLEKPRSLSAMLLFLLVLNALHPNEARVVESGGDDANGLVVAIDSAVKPEENQAKLASSLRQVLVPVLSGASHSLQLPEQDDNAHYSPNNRGSGNFAFRTSHRFGERTQPIDPFKLRRINRKPQAQVVAMRRHHDKPPHTGGWSQPDPRRSYSLQLNTVEGGKLSVVAPPPLRRFPLAFKGADLRNSVLPLKPGTSLKRTSDFESVFGKQTNSNSTEEDHSSWRLSSSSSHISQDGGDMFNPSSPPPSLASSENGSRRKLPTNPLQQQASMIALIRYVPVLLSVPAQQLVLPVQQTRGALQAPRRPANLVDANQADELPYYSLYRAPSERLVRYQITGEPAESASQLLQKPYQQQQLGEQQVTATSSAPQWKPAGGHHQTVALQTTLADLVLEPDYSALLPHQAHLPPPPANLQQTIALIQPGELAGAAMSLTGIPAGTAARIAYLPLSATSQTPAGMGAASKAALSSYASKLISMLRPSALLSSIAAPQQAPNSNLGPHQYPASQPQVYLLAPAESLTTAPNNRHVLAASQSSYPSAASVNQARQMALIKADELLLNQASTKLHHQSSSSSSSSPSATKTGTVGQFQVRGQPTSWLHEQPNGLICVHSISMQTDSQTGKFQAPEAGKSARFQQAPHLLVSPFVLADEQTVLGGTPPVPTSTAGSISISDNPDGGSFEYVPQVTGSTTTTTTDRPAKSAAKQATAARWPPSVKSEQQQQSVKESPAKLAKRLKSSATSSTPSSQPINQVQELSQQTIQDEEPHFEADFLQRKSPASSKQLAKLVSSSSENRSYLEGNTSSFSPAKREKMDEPIQSSTFGLAAPDDKQSIIPFTIKDKIEMPFRRGQSMFNSNDPVQYDEQVEGETESPKQVKQSGSSLDERRAKTSFVSATARYTTTPMPNEAATGAKRHKAPKKTPRDEIDYLKEVGPAGSRDTISGYTLPLLIASSSGARGRHNEPSNSFFRSRRPVGVTSAPPPLSTTVSELGASGSSPVTTSSTANGQPVTLASGRLNFNNAPQPAPMSRQGQQQQQQQLQRADESQLILVSSSSLAKPEVRASGNRTTSAASQQQRSGGLAEAAAATTPLELVVDSSPAEQQQLPLVTGEQRNNSLALANESQLQHLSTQPATASLRELAVAKLDELSTVPTTMTTTTMTSMTTLAATTNQPSERLDLKSGGGEQAQSNHLQETSATGSGLFSHDRSLSMGAGSSPDEFGRISESLQTNPIDLIDLQNSRSSFALPAQLESWSMFAAHPQQQTRPDNNKRLS